jgi:hypothetical protein
MYLESAMIKELFYTMYDLDFYCINYNVVDDEINVIS